MRRPNELALSVSATWKHDVWLDGRVAAPEEAQCSAMSHGLHYGTGVFEGIRLYRGKMFQLRLHIERLLASALVLGMEIPYDCNTLCSAVSQIADRSMLHDGYIRAICWFGDENLGLQTSGLTPHVAIMIWAWPKVFQGEEGLALHLSRAKRPSPEALPPQAKTTGGYLIGYLAHREARRQGYDDCLLLDFEGYIAETSSANFFLVRNGVLLTPKADRFLNGITRQVILDLARDLGIETHEMRMMPKEIATCSEAFLTGTAVEVCPITRIENQELSIGPTTLRLKAAYKEMTGGNRVD